MKGYVLNFLATSEHKFWVMVYLGQVCWALAKRGIFHDMSKYSPNEEPGFRRLLPQLRESDYGSDQYKSLLRQLGPVLAHHYKANRHHPEFHDNGFFDMNELDRLEALCDWRAATRRFQNGDLKDSIEQNRERYGYDVRQTHSFWEVAKEAGLVPSDSEPLAGWSRKKAVNGGAHGG
jgi:hypothetical protein